MLPNPLHPAVVHFPVVLAFLLPVFAIGALWVIRRGTRMRVAWSLPLGLAIALTASAWLAVTTGGNQGERVERVVSEQVIEEHEEMAEAFLAASAVLTAIAALGLIGGRAGKVARVLTAAGAVVLMAGAARVGHAGGQLVYKYGAGSAYAAPDSARVSNGDVEHRRGGDDGR